MSAIAATSLNGVKIYNLASGKILPQWILDKKKRALRKDQDYQRRVELIQDFHFDTASQKIQMSNDGNYVVVTGTYPPVVKVYDVRELSMKFERNLDQEVVQFQILSDDFGKFAFLHTDRTISFHAPYGFHYATRIPAFGRDMIYNASNCDLTIASSGPEIYRLNLDQGRFLAPFSTQCSAVNAVRLNPMHQMLGAAGDNGIVECWDPRTRSCVGSLEVGDSETSVTALDFAQDGLTLGVGTSTGTCLLYDLRSTKPLMTKTHQYGLPIQKLSFHESSGNLVSNDAKIIKIWNRHSGKIFTNIETPAPMNDVCVVKTQQSHSGVILAAGDQSRVMSYYVPELGYAPKWCSFLDSITDELEEEAKSTVYDDYKFITKSELDTLGLAHLIGTPLLKASMHGFFMDARLHAKVQSVATPFAYDEWRKAQIQKKIAAKQGNRITLRKKLPEVNRNLAQRLLSDATPESLLLQEEQPEDEDMPEVQPKKKKATKAAKKKKQVQEEASALLQDTRFSKLFSSSDFQVDEDSEIYRHLHPNAKSGPVDDHEQDSVESGTPSAAIFQHGHEDDDEDDASSDDYDSNQSDDEDKTRHSTHTDQFQQVMPSKSSAKANAKTDKVQFYELANRETLEDVIGFGKATSSSEHKKRKLVQTIPLGERVAEQAQAQARESNQMTVNTTSAGAVREFTFVPKSKSSSSSSKSNTHRRGMQDLK